MTIGCTRIKKKRTKNWIQIMQSVLVITVTITLTQPASIGSACFDKLWKNYPYYPPGTSIVFPTDEGSHNEKYEIEWWYANFHLKGLTTQNDYGAMVTFYQIKTDALKNVEYRVFSISDLSTTPKMYTNIQFGTLLATTDHLNLSFKNIFSNGDIECSNANASSNSDIQPTSLTADQLNINMAPSDQTILENMATLDTTQSTLTSTGCENNGFTTNNAQSYDYWNTKSNGKDLLPFQYTLNVGGISQQDHQSMQLSVDMDCQKQPLLVGGTGFVLIGKDGFSYYYSLTRLSVIGTIMVHGINEPVSGIAWMDHQWGNFKHQNPPPYGLTVSLEWFSIKLDDNREILTCDTWDTDTGEKFDMSLSGMNFLNNDGRPELLTEYQITPIHFFKDEIDRCSFADQWRITEKSKSIDLTVVSVFPEQIIRITENHPLMQSYFSKILYRSYFWEGVCSVSGMINGQNVHGKAYVELTHNYEYTMSRV